MLTITLILVMFVAVLVASILVRMSPVPLPSPLVQIFLGTCIGMVSDWRLELDPQVFFLMFLPPLLFLDGWQIPKEGLFRDRGMILALALGLVVFTVLGVGYFVHWLIPTIPLSVAFALAAVISPTDPVAVSAIAARVPVPKRLMHILEGESLLNDASGLVCLRFAVAATLTGSFVLTEAFLTFLQLSLGGIAIGVAITWIINKSKSWISHRFGEETGAQILISLIMPFLAYQAAEHLHCSGILAAVAAGIAMSYNELSGKVLAVTRVQRTAVWDMLQFALNGLIFVLLGEQLPGIVAGASLAMEEIGRPDWQQLLFYVLVINLALGLLRFAWVWISIRVTRFFGSKSTEPRPRKVWRIAAATSVAGARGAITLAGVLTLPLVMNDGTPFPARDLAILLAAGVIIVSLIVASIGMPLLLKGIDMPAEPERHAEVDRARDLAAEAAIRAIEQAQHKMSEGRPDVDLYIQAAARITDIYRYRIDSHAEQVEKQEDYRMAEEIERHLRLAGLRAERDELFRLARRKLLDEEVARKLIRDIDLMETQQVR
ncbi:Na+/H+ antiporter [Azomonas macrocytogenes]|uniref:CPA1 family monovalent cation:H+ antiporter n=1 Tax=Azomonas macrocytogenes TaxID=69962 RepID=A0A839TAI3_AZOMA|nr:Na+/H+ antiporter [Azomonas macrocytogenes]MBB3105045.1 CPA1 family monovalent cation:H+ antiporter [Azomonas macrocytogenes]